MSHNMRPDSIFPSLPMIPLIIIAALILGRFIGMLTAWLRFPLDLF